MPKNNHRFAEEKANFMQTTNNTTHVKARLPKQRVALQDLRFYAYHGFYPEEQQLGNEFFVDVSVTFDYREQDAGKTDEGQALDHTVNYEVIYRLVKEEMDIPRQLLETACYDIFERLILNFSFLDTVNVRIRKSNPPFGGDAATAVVEIDWQR